MCMKANCTTCRKITWVGCGSHISSVLDNIPPQEWCVCEPKIQVNDKTYPPGAKF